MRTVVNDSGVVVKQIDYDSFGNIISETNQDLKIPFGFVGGLYDRDTGLVRFGYRDYINSDKYSAIRPEIYFGA